MTPLPQRIRELTELLAKEAKAYGLNQLTISISVHDDSGAQQVNVVLRHPLGIFHKDDKFYLLPKGLDEVQQIVSDKVKSSIAEMEDRVQRSRASIDRERQSIEHYKQLIEQTIDLDPPILDRIAGVREVGE